MKIVLTGGGTAGHVMPHIAWLEWMREHKWDVSYIGSHGIEKTLIERENIPFYEIPVGKLRRYWSVQNFIDPFKVIGGFLWSLVYLLRLRPNVVLSKGGFVSVPVSFAARCLGIPVVIHESDVTPGLANRLSKNFAKKILFSFPETANDLPASAQWLAPPIRSQLYAGKKETGYQTLGFDTQDPRPIVLFMGGSLGAARLNQAVVEQLSELLPYYRIVHLTGQGKKTHPSCEGYQAYEYLDADMADVLTAADFVVARAGANSIFEFLELEKPMLLVPLEIGSRGDQLLNARSFEGKGWAHILREHDMKEGLQGALKALVQDAVKMKHAQKKAKETLRSSQSLFDILENVVSSQT